MTYPRISRPVMVGDHDCAGHPIITGRQYDLDKMRPNLIYGGGWENSLAAWSILPVGARISIHTPAPGDAYEGGRVLVVEEGTVDWSVKQSLSYLTACRVRAGRSYIIRCWVFGDIAAKLTVEWYDANMTLISTTTASTWTYNALAWAAKSAAVTAPARAKYARPGVEDNAMAPTEGYVDQLEMFPSLPEVRSATADDPTFRVLVAGATRYIDLEYPTDATSWAVDDPVTRWDTADSVPYQRIVRGQRRTLTAVFTNLAYGFGELLEHFHSDTRGGTFTFMDWWGEERTVCWRGPCEIRPVRGTSLVNLTLPLESYGD
jgi:hypothetical protein